MSQSARVFAVANTLSKALVAEGGMTSASLIVAAEQRVTDAGATLAEGVNVEIRRLTALCRAGGSELTDQRASIRTVALRIAGVAGAVGRPTAGAIAKGIVQLIDHLAADSAWRPDVLSLHLSALALVQAEEIPPDEARILLDQLYSVRQHLGVSDDIPPATKTATRSWRDPFALKSAGSQ